MDTEQASKDSLLEARVHPKSATYWVTLGKFLDFLSCSVSTKKWEINTIRI